MTDQELKDLVASLAIDAKESRVKSMAEFDAKLEKSRVKSMAEFDAKLEKSRIESKARSKELDARFKETKDFLDKVGKQLGGIGNSQGEVAEEFFWNSISSNPVLAGIKYDFAEKNRHKKIAISSTEDIEDEYDILLVNGEDVAIIETKYKARLNDIDNLLTKKHPNFKQLFPEYRDYNHHLVIASFSINDEVKKKALDENIIVLQRKGDVFETFVA